MQKAPRVDDHPHVQRDPGDPKRHDVARRGARPLNPVTPLGLVERSDRLSVARIRVPTGERRQLDPELLFVDQPDQAPAVEPVGVPTAVEPWKPDVPVRPPRLEHQKRSGKRYGVNLWLFDRTRSTLSKLISPTTETAV